MCDAWWLLFRVLRVAARRILHTNPISVYASDAEYIGLTDLGKKDSSRTWTVRPLPETMVVQEGRRKKCRAATDSALNDYRMATDAIKHRR